jgi:hypothetical protein
MMLAPSVLWHKLQLLAGKPSSIAERFPQNAKPVAAFLAIA